MKLLDAICYGFKRYLEPYFIAHSERVKSKTELEEFRKNPLRQLEFAQEFMKNAGGRFSAEDVRELTNICNVARAAVGCSDGLKIGEPLYSEEEDKEWYARFFDEVRYISDAELQAVWGRLLVERIACPSGVNNRVLYFLRDLDKKEIETIRRAMRVFLDDDFTPSFIVSRFDGMSHDITTLLALRVVYESGQMLHPLVTTFKLEGENVIRGHGFDFKMIPIGDKDEVDVGCYGLTPEGQVLSRLCVTEMTRDEASIICDHLNALWKDQVRVEIVARGGAQVVAG